MDYNRSSGGTGPTLLEVPNVEATIRFLTEGFDLRTVSSCTNGAGCTFGMLEDTSRSTRIVVVPRAVIRDVHSNGKSGGNESIGGASLTLTTSAVHLTTSAAIRAGARLLRSHRVQLPGAQNGTPRDSEVEPAEEGGEGACSTEEKERSRAEVGDTAGMVWLESPGGTVRVLLLDERLLCAPIRLAGGSRGRGDDGGLSDPSGSTSREPLAPEEGGMADKERPQEGCAGVVAGNAETVERVKGTRRKLGIENSIPEDSSVGDVGVASEPDYGSFPSLLLLGIAAMAELPGEDAAVFPPDASSESTIAPHEPGRVSTASPRNASGEVTTRNDNRNDNCRLRVDCEKSSDMVFQDSATGDSIHLKAIRREAGRSVNNEHGGGSGSGERSEVGLDAPPFATSVGGGEAQAPYREGRRPDQSLTEPINRVNGLTSTSSTKVFAESSEAGPRQMVSIHASQLDNAIAGTSDGGDQVVEQSGAGAEQYQAPEGVPKEGVVNNTGSTGVGVVNKEARLEEVSGGRRALAPEWERAERPFPMLDVSMLGNLGGPIRVVPNSLSPIPIDNEYFVGMALLIIKREPMDEAYSHMFEGKNRMFEVQVQGRFKKPPDSELFISLEITDRMKLSMFTKGLCKLLLAFGKRINNRLHYSFGDSSNSELPHLAFPLLMSVDSLICTPDGEKPPEMGKPFLESTNSKASRKRGETGPDGVDSFKTGCTYHFSFHSMYMDMIKWSTCKIPIMSDTSLRMFWDKSALRITAYFIKNSPAAKAENGRDALASSSSKTMSSLSPELHLQSELQYVFCLQIRHLTQSEQDEAASRRELSERNHEEADPRQRRGAATKDGVGADYDSDGYMENDDDDDGDDDDDDDGNIDRGIDGVPGTQGIIDSDDSDSDASAESLNPDTDRSLGLPDEPGLSKSQSSGGLALLEVSRGRGRESVRGSTRGKGGGSLNDRRSSSRRAAPTDVDYGPDDLFSTLRDGARTVESIDSSPGLSLETARSSEQETSWRQATKDPASGKGLFSGGRGRSAVRRGSWGAAAADSGVGAWENGDVEGEGEDELVRCPAYLDLYARSPKLKGKWTVFCVVKRGPRGRFSLRSAKNLSILPSKLEPRTAEFSPQLSHREVKRRKLDALLQVLTAPSRAHLNGSHQVLVRAVLGVESSADRAFRSYNPTMTPEEARAYRTADYAGSRVEGGSDERSSPTPDTEGQKTLEPKQGRGAGNSTFRVSIDQALSPAERKAGPFTATGAAAFIDSPSRDSSDRSGQGEGSKGSAGGGGTIRRPSRRWGSKLSPAVKEGMVLRVLSDHHLSQQMAVLLSSSVTFSRPRKQTLRLLMRDILHVEVGGCKGEECEDASLQFIPGLFPVEIHTFGRVYYMLVEGLSEARSWAAAIEHQTRDEKKASPMDEVVITDRFGQYMTKKSSWRAKNIWVLNARRVELSAAPPEGDWGGGCWLDRGGLGGEICDFVADLLRQAVDLNESSKPEQLIAFLDGVCRLRWMPLEGLSHAEQLAVFLNLYHVMLLHAYFVQGPPTSSLRAASCFTTLCYEVGGDVLSLAELEHCVMRARTSLPKQLLSKLIIPSTEFPFVLRQPEPRVSFALNCGSVGAVPGILLYRPETVDEQLDDASRYYVQSITKIFVNKRTVVLPKIIYWYMEDFCENDFVSPLACLMAVKRYLVGEKRYDVEALIADGGNINVKFDSWKWKCHRVALVDDFELERLRSARIATLDQT